MAGEIFTDVVIELHGAADSSRRTKESLSGGLRFDQQDLTLYKSRQIINGERLLRHFMQGVQDATTSVDESVIRPTVDEVARLLDNKHKLGGVFIAGFSLGSWYALIMTEKLARLGIDVTFVGLSDMPLFPYGLNGQLRGMGDMIPLTAPQFTTLAFGVPPRTLNAPVVRGPAVRARVKHNYFQNAGNGMSPQRKSLEFGAVWWWSSNMPSVEIHGKLEGAGWVNREVIVPQQSINDSKFHDQGDALGMAALGRDIARGLGMVQELTSGVISGI